MWPPYGPGQPDWQGFDPEQVMGGPVAYDQYPNLMRGMNQDFIERSSPYYQENMNPYGMGIPPAAPMMLGVAGPPPPPLLTGGADLGNSPKGSGGGFGWQDAFNIGLPLAAGAAGFMAGIAPQGNPQTVLQGLSLAQRAQMMPRPEQAAALQRQKFIQELIASGQATPEGLAQLKAQYPGMATEIDAVLPAAQDRSDMSRFIRSKVPGFGQTGAPPPPPGAGSSQSGSLGGGLPPPPSSGPQYDYLPSMSIGGDGKSSMSLSPHARPQPPAPHSSILVQQAIDALDTQIGQLQQMPPGGLRDRRILEMQGTRDMLARSSQFDPQSPTGKLLYDRAQFKDPYDQQTLTAAATGSSRIPMETAQGKAGEDVRMLQQGRGLTNDDPQMASMQQEADTAGLAQGNKDVAEAIGGANAVESATQQFGPDASQTQAAQATLRAKSASKPSDVMALGGQYQRAAGDFNTTRDFYRQIEQVLSSGNPNAMADISFITAMAKILDPGSVVRPSESGMVQIESRAIPDTVKLWLQNWINAPQLLTDQQRFDLVNTVRQAYYSRLQTHARTREGFESTSKSLFPDRPTSDVTGTVPLDPIDLAYLRGRPATMVDIQAARQRATTLGQPALAPWILLKQGINPFADITQ